MSGEPGGAPAGADPRLRHRSPRVEREHRVRPYGRLLLVSRPKFWLYLAGPFLLGGVLGLHGSGHGDAPLRALLAWPYWALWLWWTFPANLLLYGVNDAADYDTDRLNPKKGAGEALVAPGERGALLAAIGVAALLALPPLLWSPPRVAVAWAVFLALAVAYSVPPVRLKARPILDSLSNVLYAAPLLAGWWYFTPALPSPAVALAGVLWCAAMHAYSAIPDLGPDRRAGLRTIATLLGRDGTLIVCAACYGGAALLAGARDPLAGAVLGLYPLVMLAQLGWARARVGEWYRFFPALNALAGMALTLRFLWPLAR